MINNVLISLGNIPVYVNEIEYNIEKICNINAVEITNNLINNRSINFTIIKWEKYNYESEKTSNVKIIDVKNYDDYFNYIKENIQRFDFFINGMAIVKDKTNTDILECIKDNNINCKIINFIYTDNNSNKKIYNKSLSQLSNKYNILLNIISDAYNDDRVILKNNNIYNITLNNEFEFINDAISMDYYKFVNMHENNFENDKFTKIIEKIINDNKSYLKKGSYMIFKYTKLDESGKRKTIYISNDIDGICYIDYITPTINNAMNESLDGLRTIRSNSLTAINLIGLIPYLDDCDYIIYEPDKDCDLYNNKKSLLLSGCYTHSDLNKSILEPIIFRHYKISKYKITEQFLDENTNINDNITNTKLAANIKALQIKGIKDFILISIKDKNKHEFFEKYKVMFKNEEILNFSEDLIDKFSAAILTDVLNAMTKEDLNILKSMIHKNGKVIGNVINNKISNDYTYYDNGKLYSINVESLRKISKRIDKDVVKELFGNMNINVDRTQGTEIITYINKK